MPSIRPLITDRQQDKINSDTTPYFSDTPEGLKAFLSYAKKENEPITKAIQEISTTPGEGLMPKKETWQEVQISKYPGFIKAFVTRLIEEVPELKDTRFTINIGTENIDPKVVSSNYLSDYGFALCKPGSQGKCDIIYAMFIPHPADCYHKPVGFYLRYLTTIRPIHQQSYRFIIECMKKDFSNIQNKSYNIKEFTTYLESFNNPNFTDIASHEFVYDRSYGPEYQTISIIKCLTTTPQPTTQSIAGSASTSNTPEQEDNIGLRVGVGMASALAFFSVGTAVGMGIVKCYRWWQNRHTYNIPKAEKARGIEDEEQSFIQIEQVSGASPSATPQPDAVIEIATSTREDQPLLPNQGQASTSTSSDTNKKWEEAVQTVKQANKCQLQFPSKKHQIQTGDQGQPLTESGGVGGNLSNEQRYEKQGQFADKTYKELESKMKEGKKGKERNETSEVSQSPSTSLSISVESLGGASTSNQLSV